MPSMTFDLRVELEDGSTWDVHTDQRDMARWEMQKFGGPVGELEQKMMTALRFMAWSASKRQGLTVLTWDVFDEQCIEALPLDLEESDGADDAEDPGRTAPSDTPT